MNNGCADESLALLSDAVREPWATSVLHQRLGANLWRVGRQTEARDTLRAAMRKFPEDLKLLYELAEFAEGEEGLDLFLLLLRRAYGFDFGSVANEQHRAARLDHSARDVVYLALMRSLTCSKLQLAQQLLDVFRRDLGVTSAYLACKYVYDKVSGSSGHEWLETGSTSPMIFDLDGVDLARLLPADMVGNFDQQLREDLAAKVPWRRIYPGSEAETWRTDMRGLMNVQSRPIMAFQRLAADCVAKYLKLRRREVADLLMGKKALVLKKCWANRGTHFADLTSHIHEGVVSCVYYPELPPDLGDHDQDAGSIEFGRPNVPLPVEFKITVIRPRERRMLVFPAYAFHRIIECKFDRPRTSIAMEFHGQAPAAAAS